MEFNVDKQIKGYWSKFIGITDANNAAILHKSGGRWQQIGFKNRKIHRNRQYFYSPEQEINYLYRKNWNDPEYKKDAALEYKMKFLIKKRIHDPVAMYFRNDYLQKYEECPDNVIELYRRRNSNGDQ